MFSKFNIRNVVSDIKEIPESWIYKNYYRIFCKDENFKYITQPFDGRIIKVKSITNRDSNPSLCFFCKEGRYYWRDFSCDKGGDAIDFVADLLGKNKQVTGMVVKEQYERFLDNGGIQENEQSKIIEPVKTQVRAQVDRFGEKELDFWYKSKITIQTLNKFNIKNNSNFSIIKGKDEAYHFNDMSFSFHCRSGLYQIYQPGKETAKYITINPNYLIGSEQLQFKHEVCIIISGLKDICAITEVGLNAEYVAGPSETILMPAKQIDWLQSKYKYLLTMFDNDIAGKKSMIRYRNAYGIKPVFIGIEKDLALNNEKKDLEWLKKYYSFYINKQING